MKSLKRRIVSRSSKMKNSVKKTIALMFSFILLVNLLSNSVIAANSSSVKQYGIEKKLGFNKNLKLQLDGVGVKETLKITKETKENKKESTSIPGYFYTESFKTDVQIVLNGKQVYKKSYTGDYEAVKVEAILTDINKKDKAKDVFFAVYNIDWAGKYLELLHITYKNGKVKTENVLKTLKAIKSPKVDKYKDVSLRGYALNPIESNKGIYQGDVVFKGNGNIQWHVCVMCSNGHIHGYITLIQKNNKITAKNYPEGIASETEDDCNNGLLKKGLKLYKSPGDTNVVANLAKGEKLKIIGFKYVNKKLFIKVESKGKTGWVADSKLSILERDGALHV